LDNGHCAGFFKEVSAIAAAIDTEKIEAMVDAIANVRDNGGRLFLLGVGGSAGNCSHAVNDFRKLCDIEAYTPVDNVSELTARANDEGWHTIFAPWLATSRANSKDAVLIFSVGGGDRENNVSPNLVVALDEAKAREMTILGIVGKDTGYTAKAGDHVIVIPPLNPDRITPHSEAFQAVVWHCLVSHPLLQRRDTKWEGMAKGTANF
jgi:D-sedoheptulose 7-phosphate isomerase